MSNLRSVPLFCCFLIVLLQACKKPTDDPTPADPAPGPTVPVIPPDEFEPYAWFDLATFGNTLMDRWQDAAINPAMFDLGQSSVLPLAGSALLSGASFQQLPPFFELVGFRGAFGSIDWTEGWTTWTPVPDPPGLPIRDLQGDLNGSWQLSADTIYRLTGTVRVKNAAVLQIQAGTRIHGAFATNGRLVVEQGGRILAEGASDAPIVFTSDRPNGIAQPGDWGGVTILGNAVNNAPGGTTTMAGIPNGTHGGSNDNDDSGVLTHVQIHFAGRAAASETPAALRLGSVGRGTTIEHVQVVYSAHAGFHFAGGTAESRRTIAMHGLSEDYVYDLGHSGHHQFIYCKRSASLASLAGTSAIRVRNNEGNSSDLPRTAPILSNITVIGAKKTRETAISLQFRQALWLHGDCQPHIHNSFFTGFPNGLYLDGLDAVTNAGQHHLRVRHSTFAGVDHWGGNGYGSAGTIFTGPPSNGDQHPQAPRGQALSMDL